MWATETPPSLLSVVPLIVWTRARVRRPLLALLASFVVAVWLSYLFYRAFGLWQYLRFLLPIIPVLLVLASCGVAMLLGRLSGAGERIVAAMLVIASRVFPARRRHPRRGRAWLLAPGRGVHERGRIRPPAPAGQRGHPDGAAQWKHSVLLTPADAAVGFPPAGVVAARCERARRAGYRPYVLVTGVEEEPFRSRFGLSAADDAPGTLVATLRGPEVTRLYDPLRLTRPSGASIPTVMTRPCGCLQPSERR